MINETKKVALALVLGLTMTGAAVAEPLAEAGLDDTLVEQAFGAVQADELQLLDQAAMESTEGELWPFVFGVAGLDIALSAYFYGVYVPAISGTGGFCVSCNWPQP
ncbi:MAG: hypothetical protein V2I82_14450 [Halieaceae bacterium]|jgi:hypothetical protein|nr:hypothetical protein [Halieaceae bacterium]